MSDIHDSCFDAFAAPMAVAASSTGSVRRRDAA